MLLLVLYEYIFHTCVGCVCGAASLTCVGCGCRVTWFSVPLRVYIFPLSLSFRCQHTGTSRLSAFRVGAIWARLFSCVCLAAVAVCVWDVKILVRAGCIQINEDNEDCV